MVMGVESYDRWRTGKQGKFSTPSLPAFLWKMLAREYAEEKLNY